MMKQPWFWLAAVLGILLDRLTKIWVVQTMALGQSIPLWPGVFQLTYIENPGAAWSLFQEAGGFLRWVSLGVAIALVLFALLSPRLNRWEQVGYGCILAGAVGNGYDRFATGAVVDFFDLTLINFPIFNVADVAINIGVACLFIALIRTPRPDPTPSTPASETPDPEDSHRSKQLAPPPSTPEEPES